MLSEMSAVRKRRRGCSSVSAAAVTPLKSRIPDCSPFPSFPTAFGQQKAALSLAITTLVLSTVALGIGDYIATRADTSGTRSPASSRHLTQCLFVKSVDGRAARS